MDVFFVQKPSAVFRTPSGFVQGFYVFEAGESADLDLVRQKKCINDGIPLEKDIHVGNHYNDDPI